MTRESKRPFFQGSMRRFTRSPRDLVLWLALFVAGAVSSLWIGALWQEYESSMAIARQRASDAAFLVQERMQHTLGATRLVLNQLEAVVHTEGIKALSGPEGRERLRAMAGDLPESGNLIIVEADGTFVTAAAGLAYAGQNARGRRYWDDLQQAPAGSLVVGELMKERLDGKTVFTVSRPLRDAEGHFQGALVAGLEAASFAPLHFSLGLGPGAVVAVVRRDGLYTIRAPQRTEDLGHDMSDLEVCLLPTKLQGTLVAPAEDGEDRIYAYRDLVGMPLRTIVSIPTKQALATWRQQVNRAGALGLAILTVIAALAISALQAIQREERVREVLRRANETLEQRVQDRTNEVRRKAAEADRANQAKSRFLAAASHDLRQPLQATRLFLDTLAVRLTDPQDKRIVSKAQEALEGGEGLLRSLLDMSTLDAGIVVPQPKAFPIAQVLDQISAEMTGPAAQKGLRLSVVPSSAWTYSDPILLQRALRNLTVNAIRYTDSGGVVLGCRRRSAQLVVQVVDSGKGIPAAELEAVFEEFYQLENPERDRAKGLGLGLAIVKRMVQLLDHRIEVKSHPGRGSAFSLLVPRLAPKVAPRPEALAAV